jgi:hypothetical protein
MQGEGHPDLRFYVMSMTKVVVCRDVFKHAWTRLGERVEKRRSGKATRDPIEEILVLVQKLAVSES